MYFRAYLVVGFHSHIHLSSFNINTNIHIKGECKTVPSLTFVTIYLIRNPQPDKYNTCTTIHYHDGDIPLRNVCRPISALRTVYRHVLASSTAYRFKTKQPFWEFHLHKEDKMPVCCVHMYNHSPTRYIWCLLVCLLDTKNSICMTLYHAKCFSMILNVLVWYWKF